MTQVKGQRNTHVRLPPGKSARYAETAEIIVPRRTSGSLWFSRTRGTVSAQVSVNSVHAAAVGVRCTDLMDLTRSGSSSRVTAALNKFSKPVGRSGAKNLCLANRTGSVGFDGSGRNGD